MSKKTKKKKQTRAEPQNTAWLCSDAAYDVLVTNGYTRLSDNPEIKSAVSKIASLIGGMTIHLKENGENGDRNIKNELSRKIDIDPNPFMTRKTFVENIVRNLLLEGDGNALVLPHTRDGILEYMQPIQPGAFNLIQDNDGYKVDISGHVFDPSEVLHFVINPDPYYPWRGTGYRKSLKDIAHNLKQATETKKGFMESKWKPPVIIKADSMIDEMSTAAGRRKLLDSYVATTEAGEPWVIPAEQFDVEVVRPLTLTDLAISDSVTIDKKTVASILDVPAFVVGAGPFDEKEWNNFIKTRIRSICCAIEQELTKKILVSPYWYFRFNIRSLMAYDLKTLSTVANESYVRGIMTGNEVRDWMELSPKEGLDELVMLENYIPASMIGEQNKLKGGGDDGE